ncbi:MAG: LPS assembly lipoprotein LptE [Bryobacteraceae bacterium]
MKYLAVILLAALASCGYHTAGKADLLPSTIKTVAIPAFANTTIRYKVTDAMPSAFSREFIAHTRYRVVSDPGQADMILQGTILTYTNNPTIFDQKLQRANVADMHITMDVKLVERATGRILFQRSAFEVKESYQISPDANQYFEESDIAIRRASERVAQQVVTSILENF